MLRQKQKLTALICGLFAVLGLSAKAGPPMLDTLTDALAKKDAKDSGGGMAGVAVVDMTRLYDASGAALEYDRKTGEFADDAQRRVKTIAGVSQLARDELQEFITLAGKITLTDAEQKRQKILQALSDQRQADYRALQGKTDLTPADTQNLRAFADQEKLFRDQELPNIGDGFRQDAAEKLAQFRAVQLNQIRAVVAQIAKQKRITHVFDSSVLVYCENDLTAAVLLKLTKKK